MRPIPVFREMSPKKRKLLFRAGHRGIKEMDMILGSFAEQHLPLMSDDDVEEFEAILELNDHDLLKWITHNTTPAEINTPLFSLIVSFAHKK